MAADSSARKKWIRRAIAWGVTALVILFLLSRYSLAEVSTAITQGNWAGMIPFVAGVGIWSLLCMATADWVAFSAALGRLPWLAVLRGKAGASVLQAINHSVGQGAYAVWIGRRTRAGLQTTVGVMAFIVASDLTALFAVASVSVWLVDPASIDQIPQVEALRYFAPLVAVGLIGAFFIAPHILPRLIKRAVLLEPWKLISPAQYAVSLFFRASSLIGILFATYFAMNSFGLDVPLGPCLALLPIIFLAGALPINVFGFGAVQLVWIAAFERFTPGEEILAFQFLLHLMLVAVFLVRGAPFLPSVLREIEGGKPSDADSADSDD